MSPFSELLSKALTARGMRGYQLADASGSSRGAVSEANTGKDAPRDEVARKWAEILKIDGPDLEAWLDAAATQRAQRTDNPARGGEGRMARRIEHLERMERNLVALAAELAENFIADEGQRDRVKDLIERDVALFDSATEVQKALSNALRARPL